MLNLWHGCVATADHAEESSTTRRSGEEQNCQILRAVTVTAQEGDHRRTSAAPAIFAGLCPSDSFSREERAWKQNQPGKPPCLPLSARRLFCTHSALSACSPSTREVPRSRQTSEDHEPCGAPPAVPRWRRPLSPAPARRRPSIRGST